MTRPDAGAGPSPAPRSPEGRSRPVSGPSGWLSAPSVADVHLLFVCTGNICRSPVAERLTTRWAEQALGAGAVHVASAGTDAMTGHAMHESSARALARLGGDPTGFLARSLVPGEAEDADLVLTMTRRQRHIVLRDAPRAMRRTFTLPEAAGLLALADLVGLADLPVDQRARELALRLHAGRRTRPSGPDDDVRDPIGHPQAVHTAVAEQVAQLLEPLTALLFAGAPVPVAAGQA